MKTLVTHINPHLDDIAAIWLLKKYDPQFSDALVEFISASHDKSSEETEDRVFVGTGGGKFDEHKEGLDTCAGSLVFEYLKSNNLLPQDQIIVEALEELVEWNKLIDTGKAPASEFSEFSIQAIIRPKDGKAETSLKAVELGREILDRLLEVLKVKVSANRDWENRIEFETQFGKTIAISSSFVDRSFCKQKGGPASPAGGDLFLIYDPKYPSVQFFTPSFEIDLEPIYIKLKEVDGEADWFLHQSHHMVICGSGSAPESKLTNLTFEKLIDLSKQI